MVDLNKIFGIINGSVELEFEEQFFNGFTRISVKVPQGPVQVKENMFIRAQFYAIVAY